MSGVTLYHGTSTLFLHSIKESGLGAVNPVEKYRLNDLLAFLTSECEHRIPNNPEFNRTRLTTHAMLNQERFYRHPDDTQQRQLNFRHGSTYLAAIENGAAFYACQNRLGSELLSRCEFLVRLLLMSNEPVNIPRSLNGILLDAVVNTNYLPIVIEANSVPLSCLNNEHGMPAEVEFNHLRTKTPMLTAEAYIQVAGVFELTQPIPSWALRFSRVMCQANITNADFSYRLIEIS